MELGTDILGNFALGLSVALTAENLLYCLIGVFVGQLVGVLPGMGSLAAISMLFPMTFHMDPTSALIMLAGMYYGTAYGGSTTSILLNLPGGPSQAVSCLDGYPMTRQGRGGVALFLTTIASFVSGSIGIILMMTFAPVIVRYALNFGSTEYFSMMLMGLVAASTMSGNSVLIGIAMAAVGMLIGIVGIDIYSGATRLTFGRVELLDGVSLVSLAVGLFGIAEVIRSVNTAGARKVEKVSMRSMIPTRDDMRRFWGPTFRGTAIGSFFGILPGTGATIASFVSYAVEKRVSRTPERFGHGALEGVIAPDAADNASNQASFIPTMALGIPGTATMALLLGVLLIHGITPGPRLMVEQPTMFWGLVMSFWIGNVILVILNIPMIGLWIRLLQVPYNYLYPSIICIAAIGVYSINNSSFEILLMLVFALVGYLFKLMKLPLAPLILGFVLGPMMEEHFRRSMIIYDAQLTIFIERPLSAALLAICAAMILGPFIKRRIAGYRTRRA